MEHQPNNNHIENVEVPLTRERVVELLTRFPDNIKPYVEYIERREKEVQVAGDTIEQTETKTLTFLIEQAEMLRDAGLTEFAISAYEDVLLMVEAKGMEVEYNTILGEITKLEDSSI